MTNLRDFKVVRWLLTLVNRLPSKVGWIKAGDQTILTLHKRVITHNDRIHITHDEHNTWNLHIRYTQCEGLEVSKHKANVIHETAQNFSPAVTNTVPTNRIFDNQEFS